MAHVPVPTQSATVSMGSRPPALGRDPDLRASLMDQVNFPTACHRRRSPRRPRRSLLHLAAVVRGSASSPDRRAERTPRIPMTEHPRDPRTDPTTLGSGSASPSLRTGARHESPDRLDKLVMSGVPHRVLRPLFHEVRLCHRRRLGRDTRRLDQPFGRTSGPIARVRLPFDAS